MEKNGGKKQTKCPICGKLYTEHPALSRVDNETLICPDCGIREALDSIKVRPDEQERIVKTIHKYTGEEE